MKTRRTVWVNGFLLAALVATTAAGCGSDDDDDGGGSGGTAGKGGSAGTAGKGGTGGTVGKGGTGGTVGKGGTGGTAGKGGGGGSSGSSSGAAGTGEAGAAGGAGIGGSAGDAGSGTGGTDAGGTGGDAGGMGGQTSGGEGGMAGDSGDSGGAGGEPSVEPACETYCSLIVSTCNTTGEHAQYPNQAQCLATCATFPTEGNTGNTLGCRLTHAGLAATAGLDPHCDHAGPAGVGTCGSNCESYCTLMMSVCDGTFATEAACLTACAAVPEATFTNFVYPAPEGNTLQCRISHATNAAASTGDVRTAHCSHAAGADPCD